MPDPQPKDRPHPNPGGRPLAMLAAAAMALALNVRAAPALSGPILQEILYDGPGADSDDAFTEIAGPPGTDLDGWSLVGINGGDGSAYRTVDLTGAIIQMDGLLVVTTTSAADSLAALGDFIGSIDWQNGPDAVQLRDPSGNIIDALQYGDAGVNNAGEGVPAPTVSAGQSLSRDLNGTDTDDNLADFSPQTPPSPGSGLTLTTPPNPPATGPTLSIPDTTATSGDQLVVPICISSADSAGILAIEVFVSYDSDLLGQMSVQAAMPLLTPAWALVANTAEGTGTSIDTLKIAMATDADTLAGAGALVQLTSCITRLNHPSTTPLHLTRVLLNDGDPAPAIEHGSLHLVGHSGSMGINPAQVAPPEGVQIVLRDADGNQHPAEPDSLQVRVIANTDLERVTLVENGDSTATFLGSVNVVIGAAAPGNGVVEASLGEQISFCYDDSLDELGNTVERCAFAQVQQGHTGSIAATAVCQPGDTLRVRVTDPDLNGDDGTLEQTQVVAASPAAHDTETVLATEITASDSLFHGSLPTTPLASAPWDGTLTVSPGEPASFTYLDESPQAGPPAPLITTTRIVSLFGDADGNGLLQAFDASQVLAHVLSPFLTAPDSMAANVDSLAPWGSISPYDAALILQHRVGLRTRFPIQEPHAANHPQAQVAAPSPKPLADGCRIELREQDGDLSVWLGDRVGIVAGELIVAGVHGSVAMGEDLGHFLCASRRVGDDLRIVFAGGAPGAGPGDLVRIRPSHPLHQARLLHADFNDGAVPVRNPTGPTRIILPDRARLYPNYPNPFNPSTSISFYLPAAGAVRLEILNLLGQRICTLMAQELPAGHHRLIWDARDDARTQVATGPYLCQLRTGPTTLTRRILYLK